MAKDTIIQPFNITDKITKEILSNNRNFYLEVGKNPIYTFKIILSNQITKLSDSANFIKIKNGTLENLITNWNDEASETNPYSISIDVIEGLQNIEISYSILTTDGIVANTYNFTNFKGLGIKKAIARFKFGYTGSPIYTDKVYVEQNIVQTFEDFNRGQINEPNLNCALSYWEFFRSDFGGVPDAYRPLVLNVDYTLDYTNTGLIPGNPTTQGSKTIYFSLQDINVPPALLPGVGSGGIYKIVNHCLGETFNKNSFWNDLTDNTPNESIQEIYATYYNTLTPPPQTFYFEITFPKIVPVLTANSNNFPDGTLNSFYQQKTVNVDFALEANHTGTFVKKTSSSSITIAKSNSEWRQEILNRCKFKILIKEISTSKTIREFTTERMPFSFALENPANYSIQIITF